MRNPIVYAVPVFLLLMVVEFAVSRQPSAVSRRRGQPVYRAADTVGSLSLGSISQLVAAFTKLAGLGVYVVVYQHVAPRQLAANSAWVWAGALLAYDLLYYWHHRLGHTVHLLWAAHAVHHSSEDYNLGTALRQTGSGVLFGWLFYLPLALAGVPALVFVVVGLVDLLYQFWVHTQLVGRLGWADRVFVTPSNHRVHHSQNSYCLDRNYGGILILWDRLFGTFADERVDEPIVYGMRGALRSSNPLWANAQGYANIARAMAAAPRWRDKLRVPLMPPGWLPPGVVAPPPLNLAHFQHYAPPLSAPLAVNALLQLAVLITFALHFLLLVSPLHGPAWWALWAGAGAVTAAALWRAGVATMPMPMGD